MFEPLTIVECLLMVLMATITFRSFFAMRDQSLFTGGIYLLCNLILVLMFTLLPAPFAWMFSWFLLWLYSDVLFQGAFWKKGLLLAGMSLVYGLLFMGCDFYLQYCSLSQLPSSVLFFSSLLLAQLVYYVFLQIARTTINHQKYAITYYFPVVPILLTFAFLAFWKRAFEQYLYLPMMFSLFFVLIAFDYSALIFQNWLIASLHTRTRIRMEEVRREVLHNKYEVLEKQYEQSFSFLHQLLRSLADLSVSLENQDEKQIESQVHDIASQAFTEFNKVCINAPVLSSLLAERKELLEKERIHVSTIIRNDQFGLLTFEEQRQLFSSLLDFVIEQAKNVDSPIRTLIIKSAVLERDLMMFILFPARKDPALAPGFRALQKKLSRTLGAGLKITWDPAIEKYCLTMIMPMAWHQLEDLFLQKDPADLSNRI